MKRRPFSIPLTPAALPPSTVSKPSHDEASAVSKDTLPPPPPAAWSALITHSQKIAQDFVSRQPGGLSFFPTNPFALGMAWLEIGRSFMQKPDQALKSGLNLWEGYMKLWQDGTQRFWGMSPSQGVTEQKPDKRFADPLWQDSAVFSYIKDSYLLTARWIYGLVQQADQLDDKSRKRLDFMTRQFLDALSPSNFLFTNPQVLRTTLESGGENLLRGLQNLLEDLDAGQGQLKISMTDPKAFRLGENIATTPGQVVFRNDLMELIQYSPQTEQVYETPLLIIPPWINKFYILDLQPKNSLVNWLVQQGYTVFMVSWVNPSPALADKSFADYLREGPLDAMRVIGERLKCPNINIAGYCLGGTLLACLLAYLAEKAHKDLPTVTSATFLTTLIDFTDPGELGLFIDEEMLAALDEQMKVTGVFPAQAMAQSFNLLRANDLIWSFVVNNYLLGKEPLPFDLLYWNADSTNMPAAMHSFYLRNMYQQNKLIQPGGLELLGVRLDLRKIKLPTYMLACREDHIAPWAATFEATKIYSGPNRFVLSASGHIAGVINPPSAKKYCYWTQDHFFAEPQAWQQTAAQHAGSWWTDWAEWLIPQSGKLLTARDVTDGLCPAPGLYVQERT